MVDAAHTFRSAPATRAARADAQVEVTAATTTALQFYRNAFDGPVAPPQSPAWVESWVTQTRPEAIIATLSREGQPVCALALEVARMGPFRIARFLGDTHANANFPLARRAWLARAAQDDIASLIAGIGRARPDIDLVFLARLVPELDGLKNPLSGLPGYRSANISLSVSLAGGFEILLARISGKRKRKKHRSQSRKFDAAGGYRRIEASTPAEIDLLLEAFLEMKHSRFARAGIHDVFADPGVKTFFRELFVDSLDREPRPFSLHAIEVGGVLRAVTGSSHRGDTMICEFGAIREDEIASASPGEFLSFMNIQEACERGLGAYDFSVGDEQYKRLWCDIETEHRDATVPLTLKGHGLAHGLRLAARGKRFVKTNPTIWNLVKRLRKQTSGAEAKAVDTDD